MIKAFNQRELVPVGSTALLTIALATGSFTAAAQQMQPLVLEEVVVTATKTEELASDIAISANVLTASNLAEVNAIDFTEISKIAPGLDFASTRDPVSGAIKLRNVGSESFEGGNDKAVAVFVDGFVQSVPNAVFSTLMDVERIEVLRGPQGTLYGKNAPAGVISITTRRPDFEGINGYVKGTLANYDTYNTEGALNVPLIDDKLAMRASVTTGESDGYYYNEILHRDSGDYNRKDGRFKLLFTPADDLSMLLSYRNANIQSGVPVAIFDGVVPFSTGLGANGGAIVSDPEDLKTYAVVDRASDTDLEEAGFTVEWDIGDYSLTSLTGYSEFDLGIHGGNNGYPVVARENVLDNQSFTRQVTQELRLNSYAMDDLQWLAGIYYSHMDRSGFTSLGPQFSEQSKVGETWGYYGNAVYDVSDKWRVTLGLRYNDEKKALAGNTLFGSAIRLSDNYYNTSGSLKVQYFVTPDVMVYTAVDTAYRSGDFNDFAAGFVSSPLLNVIPGGSDFAPRFVAFGAEESEALEIGMKGKFFDGRARANIAYFYQVFHDYQRRGAPENGAEVVVVGAPRSLSTFIPGVTLTVDKLITQGIEMDGQYLFTENWSGSAAATYAHAVTDEFPNSLCSKGEAPTGQLYCPADGARLNDDPLWTANIQVAYENSWSEFDYTARLIANYKSAPTYDNGRTTTAAYDDYNSDSVTLDASFSVVPVQQMWSASVWVKNLTDERRPATEGLLVNSGDPTITYGAFIPPRTYGVTAQYNF